MVRKITINECQKAARSRGGTCISTKYTTKKDKMLWECEFGHQWQTTYEKIDLGRWCHKCTKTHKYTILDPQNVAIKNNGACLSEEYTNRKQFLEWKCEVGHTWFEKFETIGNNKWCPTCTNRRIIAIDECIEYAKSHNGKCLSTNFVDSNTKMKWECWCGYVWQSTYGNLKYFDRWCPKCSKKDKKTIDDATKIARERGGECLSNNIINTSSKLLWKCKCGFEWKASFNNVKNKKSWCPKCKKYKEQNALFEVVKKIFGEQNVYYNYTGFEWLKHKRKLHLDIFVENHKIAIEYDGIQHFVPIEYFGGKEKFRYQQKMDKIKEEKIKVHYDDVKHFIRFNYKERITNELVICKLRASGVVIGEKYGTSETKG